MLRAHFGLYFFGQMGTFIYLLNAMARAAQFNIEHWPQFSVFNLVVANFWPLYWVAYLVDAAKLNAAYWRVYEVVLARAADVANIYHFIAG